MTPTRQVVLATIISGLLFAVANGLQYANDEAGHKRIANPLPSLGGVEMLVAWGTVFLFLVIASEVPATGELAVAFAWLILLTMLFTYGVAAFQNLAIMIAAGEQARQNGESNKATIPSNRNPVAE